MAGHRPFRADGVALVVGDDEGREVLDLDLPHRFHAELGIFQNLDLLDRLQRQLGRDTADAAEIEAAMGLAALAHLT